MKILYFCTNSDRSGAPIHVLQLLKFFSNDNECYLAVGKKGELFDLMTANTKMAFVINGMQSRFNIIKDLIGILSAIKIVLKVKPDFIHCHSTKSAMYARIAGSLLRKKIIYTVHGWGFGPGIKKTQSNLVFFIEYLLTKFTDAYIFVSHYDHQSGMKRLNISKKSCYVVYNSSVDQRTKRISPAHKLRVTMIARVSHQKDYQTLFNATRDLDIQVNCVGSGTKSDEFIADAMMKNHKNSFKFYGSTGNVMQILANSDIFVLSSRYEGLPISIIEAMSAELPIIATRVGGVPELVQDGANGYTFEPGDWRSLRNYIKKYCENNSLLVQHGKNSRLKYEENFQPSAMLKIVKDIYDSV